MYIHLLHVEIYNIIQLHDTAVRIVKKMCPDEMNIKFLLTY